MASHQAIAAVCEGVVSLLKANYSPTAFNNTDLAFQVYGAKDFINPMPAGVSLFLYRVMANGTHRTPAGRLGPDGRRQRSQMPLELHFLLTAWGTTPSLQQTIAGWMIRTMEDYPTLSPSLLNGVYSGVFHTDEAVDIVMGEIATEDLIRLWEVLNDKGYYLSVPYIARVVRIESAMTDTEGVTVRERDFLVGGMPEGKQP
jgi:hypothetical protein